MKKLFLLLSILLITTEPSAQTKWFNGSFEEAKITAESNNKYIYLLFNSKGF